jgi:hypothetical protein
MPDSISHTNTDLLDDKTDHIAKCESERGRTREQAWSEGDVRAAAAPLDRAQFSHKAYDQGRK